MKKTVTIVIILLFSLSYGQETMNTYKFQLGVSYSLTNRDEFFNNPLSGYGNYQLKKWDNLDLNLGLKVYFFKSKENNYFKDKWGFNPNISTSYYFKKSKLNSYLSLGYYFDTFKTDATIIGNTTSSSRNITTNGITINPGLKYFVKSNFFVDANITSLFAKTKDDFYKSQMGNNTFINIGLGIAF